jgi:hypothetical protein
MIYLTSCHPNSMDKASELVPPPLGKRMGGCEYWDWSTPEWKWFGLTSTKLDWLDETEVLLQSLVDSITVRIAALEPNFNGLQDDTEWKKEVDKFERWHRQALNRECREISYYFSHTIQGVRPPLDPNLPDILQ